MNVARLKKLIYLLENHDTLFPNTKFNMNFWGDEITENYTCATAACALGSAALYPPFMKKGLKLRGTDTWTSEILYKDFKDRSAGAAFFGITLGESDELFLPDYYYAKNGNHKKIVTRKDVIKKIKKLLVGEEL